MSNTAFDHYSAIKDVELTDFLGKDKTETTFKASDLWKEKPVIVLVIRRPGCPFCREEARELLEHRELIEKEMGFRLVTVVHEKLGAETFWRDYWDSGETFFDGTKGFYKALGDGNLRWARLDQVVRPSLWYNVYRNWRSGIRGNLLVGEGRIFGGLYIVQSAQQGPRIAYQFSETVLGNRAPISKVLEVCSDISGVALDETSLQRAKQQEEDAKKTATAQCDGQDSCALPSSSSSKL